MRSTAKTVLSSVLLLSALLMGGCGETLLPLTYTDDQFINEAEGLFYNYAPLCYEPVAVGEPYAHCSDMDMTLYEIPGTSPTDWLTEEYAGSATTVLYNADLTLPSLTELDPDAMHICLTGDRIFSIATVEDEAVIDEIIRVFYESETAVWPMINATLIYNLKFHSEKNAPAIYYNLTYGEFAEGNFLYEQSTGHCVEVGSLIMDIEA